MGVAHLPALDDYWSTDPTLHYSPVADRISRDRFREISRYLHFVDNTTLPEQGSPGYDRLGKVRPVIDHLSKRFADLYKPHREVAVDEAMIKFTGRSSVKQYMPMKPVKRGIKVHGTLIIVYMHNHMYTCTVFCTVHVHNTLQNAKLHVHTKSMPSLELHNIMHTNTHAHTHTCHPSTHTLTLTKHWQ